MSRRAQPIDPLEIRLRTILPEEYQDSYESVQPVSMGSAGLKFGADGKVAWNDMWASFCDLAMAGGPPHKGTLLEPGSPVAVAAEPEGYESVVAEIRRGIRMVAELDVQPAPFPGWVRVTCESDTMADWMLRAIVMENVSAQREGRELDLPAAPHFRLEKEIKNVVTVIAKTSHYWLGHMWPDQHQAIGELFDALAQEGPLVVPPGVDADGVAASQSDTAVRVAEAIHRATGLSRAESHYAGWVGIECGSVDAAVWMMRMVVVCNVLARREGTALFVPVNAALDPAGARTAAVAARVHALARVRGFVA